jgi:hypothetical protein
MSNIKRTQLSRDKGPPTSDRSPESRGAGSGQKFLEGALSRDKRLPNLTIIAFVIGVEPGQNVSATLATSRDKTAKSKKARLTHSYRENICGKKTRSTVPPPLLAACNRRFVL